jgi:aryl-alcohol dehydrogenase
MTSADLRMRRDGGCSARKGAPFRIESADIDAPRPEEVIVRMVATGVCHTDLLVRNQDYPTPLPAVLGHEGSGTESCAMASADRVRVQYTGLLRVKSSILDR